MRPRWDQGQDRDWGVCQSVRDWGLNGSRDRLETETSRPRPHPCSWSTQKQSLVTKDF